MARKTALITGITGQDGSYLAEFLLEQGYRVVGMTRRTSTDVHERIRHLAERIEFYSGDLLDQSSIGAIIADVRPTEIYNLAAQSFVPASFAQPVLTGEFTALGVTRVLEAVRNVDPSIRFYQASSSEMFGKVQTVPQNEDTAFYPRSPYGVAKLYGHWITVNYRESYDLFATSGLLFNHESVPGHTPVMIRRDGVFDIIPIRELVPVEQAGAAYQDVEIDGVEVWDGDSFVRVFGGSAYEHRPLTDNKGVRRIEARCGTVTTTAEHVIFLAGDERTCAGVRAGDALLPGDLPDAPCTVPLDPRTAWLLGAFVARDADIATFRNERGTIVPPLSDQNAASPYDVRARQNATALLDDPTAGLDERFRRECFTAAREKRIPQRVLQAGAQSQRAFLAGYQSAQNCTIDVHEPGELRSPSAVLAHGLWWLASRLTDFKTGLELAVHSSPDVDAIYTIRAIAPLLPPDFGAAPGARNDRDMLRGRDVLRVVEDPHFAGRLYDITTTSGRFAAGIGGLVIHNSPRRGKEFVTRKISDGVARIKLGIASELRLGNLDAQRDWGFAGDYVRAMWLMLQQDRPDDYVVATGRTHHVRDFVRLAFEAVDLDYERYVVVDPKFYRPAEVDLLIGDPAKAQRVLKWAPDVSFGELIEMMVHADIARLRPLVAV